MPDEISHPPWVDFEAEVHDHVKRKVENYQLLLVPNTARVVKKPRYFSKDREKDIIFDISVEAFTAESAQPSLIWIWECKNYPDRRVSVEEIEEFCSKMSQVGAHKGTIVTRLGFQDAGMNYAKSRRIGLAVLQKELVPVTYYDAHSTTRNALYLKTPHGIFTSGEEYGERSDFDIGAIVQIELRAAGLLR